MTEEPGLLFFFLFLKQEIDALLFTGFHYYMFICSLVVLMLGNDRELPPLIKLLFVIPFCIGVGSELVFSLLERDLRLDNGIFRLFVLHISNDPGLAFFLLLFKLEVDAFLITSFDHSSSIRCLVVSMLCPEGVLTSFLHLLVIIPSFTSVGGVGGISLPDGDLGLKDGVFGILILHMTEEPGLLFFLLLLKEEIDALLITSFNNSMCFLGIVSFLLGDQGVLASTLYMLTIISALSSVGGVSGISLLDGNLSL